jgi:hypothetical protein
MLLPSGCYRDGKTAMRKPSVSTPTKSVNFGFLADSVSRALRSKLMPGHTSSRSMASVPSARGRRTGMER